MDGFTVDDVRLRPSKLQLSQLLAMAAAVPKPGTTPTPAQTRELTQKMQDKAVFGGIVGIFGLPLPDAFRGKESSIYL